MSRVRFYVFRSNSNSIKKTGNVKFHMPTPVSISTLDKQKQTESKSVRETMGQRCGTFSKLTPSKNFSPMLSRRGVQPQKIACVIL